MSLALKASGEAWSWGRNFDYGQLGDNTKLNKSSPVSVVGAHAFTFITYQYYRSLALKADGSAWSWGRNSQGQLGDNSTTNKSSPVSVVGAHSFTLISAGGQHVAGLKANGEVWSWGDNSTYGPLGDGTVTSRSSPVSVVGDHAFTAIGTGNAHTVALKADGTAWSWGRNSDGQLGDDTITTRTSPVSVVGAHSFVAISGGSLHTVALKADGTTWTWGSSANGELGDNTKTSKSSPVSVVGNHSFVAIATNNTAHVIALKADGSAWAWGNGDFYGEIGDNAKVDRSSPVSVVGAHSFVAITAGGNNALGRKANGEVWSWGRGDLGGNGDGTATVGRSSPVLVIGSHSFVLLEDEQAEDASSSSSSFSSSSSSFSSSSFSSSSSSFSSSSSSFSSSSFSSSSSSFSSSSFSSSSSSFSSSSFSSSSFSSSSCSSSFSSSSSSFSSSSFSSSSFSSSSSSFSSSSFSSSSFSSSSSSSFSSSSSSFSSSSFSSSSFSSSSSSFSSSSFSSSSFSSSSSSFSSSSFSSSSFSSSSSSFSSSSFSSSSSSFSSSSFSSSSFSSSSFSSSSSSFSSSSFSSSSFSSSSSSFSSSSFSSSSFSSSSFSSSSFSSSSSSFSSSSFSSSSSSFSSSSFSSSSFSSSSFSSSSFSSSSSSSFSSSSSSFSSSSFSSSSFSSSSSSFSSSSFSSSSFSSSSSSFSSSSSSYSSSSFSSSSSGSLLVYITTESGAGSPNYLNVPKDVKSYVVNETEYAFIVSAGDDALTVFDVSDPYNPVHVGVLSGAGSPYYLGDPFALDIATIEGTEYAFIACCNDNSLVVVDISDPTLPTHAASVVGAGSPYYLGCAHGVKYFEIDDTPYVFVVGFLDDSLTIFDVTIPSSPVHVAEVHGSGSPYYLNGARGIDVYDISGASEYAFVASYLEDALVIYDVSDPTNPTYVGRLSGSGSPNYLDGAYDVFVTTVNGTEYAYVVAARDDALTIIDVSTPSSPSHAGVISGSGNPNYLDLAHDVYVHPISSRQFAFTVAAGDDALTAFDTSNPAGPYYLDAKTGTGAPYYLNGAEGNDVRVIGGVTFIFVVSANDDALSIFAFYPEVSGSSSSSSSFSSSSSSFSSSSASFSSSSGSSSFSSSSSCSSSLSLSSSVSSSFSSSSGSSSFSSSSSSFSSSSFSSSSFSSSSSSFSSSSSSFSSSSFSSSSSSFSSSSFSSSSFSSSSSSFSSCSSSYSSCSSSYSSSSFSSSSFSSCSSSSVYPGGQRQPTAAISRGNVVLVYIEDGIMHKRIFPYGAAVWEDPASLVRGWHPDIVDQWGYLFLVWETDGRLYYATSIDGGRNFTAPALVPIHTGGRLPSDDVLPNGFMGIAYAAWHVSCSSSSSSSSSFSSSSFSSSSSSSFSSSSSSFSSSSFSSSSLSFSSSSSSFSSSSFSSISSSFSSSSFSSVSSSFSSCSSSFSSASFSSSSYSSISSSIGSVSSIACVESTLSVNGSDLGSVYQINILGPPPSYATWTNIRMGDDYTSPFLWARYRGYLKFDISSLPADTIVIQAIVNFYYDTSVGDNVPGAAPDANDVGQCIVDHIEDYGALSGGDWNPTIKTSNIGNLIGNTTPSSWQQLDVTDYVQTDVDEADTPDTSCFRLRQSYEAAPSIDNYWQWTTGSNTPWLYVCYSGSLSSSSSSCSSSYSSSVSSSFSSSSFSSPSSLSSSSSSFSSSSSSLALPDGLYMYNVEVTGNYAVGYAAAKENGNYMGYGIVTIDITDTANPDVVSWFPVDESIYSYARYESYIVGDYLYLAKEQYTDTVPGGLLVFDVGDPLNVSIHGIFDAWPAGDLGSIFYSSCFKFDISGSILWLACSDDDVELMKVNISNPANPTLISRHRPDYTDGDGSHNSSGLPGVFYFRGCQDVSEGDNLKAAEGHDLWNLSIADPDTNPPTIWDDVNVNAVAAVGNTSYITVSGDSPNFFKKVTGMTLNGQLNISISTTWMSNHVIYHSGYVYVFTRSRLHTINTTPAVENTEVINAGGVAWDGNDMFVAGLNQGFYTYDNTDPTNPSQITQYLPWY